MRRSTAVAWVTHFEDDEANAAFARLRREARRFAHVFKVIQSPERPARHPLSLFRRWQIVVTKNDLQSPSSARRSEKLTPEGRPGKGGHDLLQIPLMRKQFSRYDHVWFIEYDVEFTGAWATFFSHFAGSSADLLGTNLYSRDQSVSWGFWSAFQTPADVQPEAYARGFLPIVRLSKRFSEVYAEEIARPGWQGHVEALYPTIALHRGLRVEDIGGYGPMVPPSRAGKFYTSSASPDLRTGTFRFRPAVSTHYYPMHDASLVPDHLCHPVKTEAHNREPGARWQKVDFGA